MTTQTVQIVSFDYGASLSSVTLRNLTTDVLVATADTCNEVTADSGVYAAVFGETSVIAAGTYRLRAVVSGAPLNRYVTLAGTDGEVVQSSSVPPGQGLTTSQATQLTATKTAVDALGVALAGMSPVEPTGVTVFEHLESISSDLNSFATVAARLAVEGQILGFPAAIVRNADYHANAESEILLTLQDLTGAAITEIAGTPVASVSWLFGMGTERNPHLVTGTATWATDRLKIEWLAAATAGKPLGTLTWQIGATVGGKTRWLGGGTTRLIERQF